MSASETTPDAANRPKRSPLEGGPWRPLKPDDLLRRGPAPEEDASPNQSAKPSLERRQELEHYIKDRPADIEAYLELAAIYREMGRSVEATRVLKIAHEIDTDHAEVLWQLEEASLARALQQLRDVHDVANRLRTPEADRELERAQVDWAARRAEVCRKRIMRNPDEDRLRVVLGEALRDLGQYEEAVEAVKPACPNDAEAPMAYLIAGQCLEHLGKPTKALVAYRHAALRRAAPASPKIRSIAMKAALDIAQRLGLTASAQIYQRALQAAEEELLQDDATQLEPVAAKDAGNEVGMAVMNPIATIEKKHQHDEHADPSSDVASGAKPQASQREHDSLLPDPDSGLDP